MPAQDDVVVSLPTCIPYEADPQALVFPLHQDYLITQSSLFRTLFAPAPGNPDAPSSSRSIKGARRLPTPPTAPPAVLLPLPDPTSFSVLVHWLYWGDITALESALSKGLVEWQGVVKNVHYLGMDDNVKRVLGKWWRRWIKTDEGRQRSGMAGGQSAKERWPLSDTEDEEGLSDDDDDDDDEDLRDEGTRQGEMELEGGAAGPARHRGGASSRDVDDHGVSGLLKAL